MTDCYVGTFDRNDKSGSFKGVLPSGNSSRLLLTNVIGRWSRKNLYEDGKVKFKGTYDRGGKV